MENLNKNNLACLASRTGRRKDDEISTLFRRLRVHTVSSGQEGTRKLFERKVALCFRKIVVSARDGDGRREQWGSSLLWGGRGL